MEIVNYKNSLAIHVKRKINIQDIINKVLSIPDIATLKLDVELIRYVANVVENIFSNDTIEKKKTCIIQVLSAVHTMNEEEIKILSSSIDFLNNIGKVKGTKFVKIYI